MPEGTFCEALGNVWSPFTLCLCSDLYITDTLYCSLFFTWFHPCCPLIFRLFLVAFLRILHICPILHKWTLAYLTIWLHSPLLISNFKLHLHQISSPNAYVFPFANSVSTSWNDLLLQENSFTLYNSFSDLVASLNVLVRHLCSPSHGYYVIVYLSLPYLTTACA